jgi:hypothetical protein
VAEGGHRLEAGGAQGRCIAGVQRDRAVHLGYVGIALFGMLWTWGYDSSGFSLDCGGCIGPEPLANVFDRIGGMYHSECIL